MDKSKKDVKVERPFPKEKIVIAVVVLAVMLMFIVKQKKTPRDISMTHNPTEESAYTENAVPSEESASTENTVPRKLPQLIDLGSETCIPCKMMQPILAELTAEYEGQMTVKFIDVYENSSVAEKYKIRGIPTQIFFDAEGKEISRNVGFIPKDEILARWKSLGYEFKKNPSSEKQDK